MRSIARRASRPAATALAVLALAALAGPALAEDAAPAADPWNAAIVANLTRTGGMLVSLAEAIPADQYGWAPNDDVRTVSEVLMHVVAANSLLPSALGAPLPEGVTIPEDGPFALAGRWEQEVTAKDAVVAKLRESFAYVTGAVPGITDHDTPVQLFGPEPLPKRNYLLVLVSHAHEHLGQTIAYARSLGVTPPWSEPMPEPEAEEEPAAPHDHGH